METLRALSCSVICYRLPNVPLTISLRHTICFALFCHLFLWCWHIVNKFLFYNSKFHCKFTYFIQFDSNIFRKLKCMPTCFIILLVIAALLYYVYLLMLTVLPFVSCTSYRFLLFRRFLIIVVTCSTLFFFFNILSLSSLIYFENASFL